MNCYKTLVKMRLAELDKSQPWLAEKLDVSQQALTRQINANNFKESRMREIADALNCDLKIELVPRSES